MRNKNPSLVSNCVDDLFKFFFNFDGDEVVLTNNIDPDIIHVIDKYSSKEYKFTYKMGEKVCPCCGGELVENGPVDFNLNKCRIIYKQQYLCSKGCRCSTIVDLSEFIDPGSNYTKRMKSMGLKIKEIGYLSHQKIGEIMGLFTGVNVSRSTVFYHEKEVSDDYLEKRMDELNKKIKELGIEPSGVFHYDEQYLWVNTDLKMRMTILDANTKLIIADETVKADKFDKHTIKNFLNTNLKDLNVECIVTDGDNTYPSIIEAIGAIHQNCVFHKMQTLIKAVYKTIRKNNRKIKSKEATIEKNKEKIQEFKNKNRGKRGRIPKKDKQRQKFSKRIKKLEKENRNCREEIKECKKENKTLKKYTNQISLIFKSKKEETAKKRFQKLLDKIEQLPDEIAPFIEKLSKNIDTTLNHIKNKLIPNTNNLLENYFGTTLPRHMKRIFRTDNGLETRLKLNRIRWIERNILKIN
jgi:hypothetical protein